MKSKTLTRLFAIVSILFFSCTKEQTNTGSNSTTAQSSDQLLMEINESADLIVDNVYALYYDWFCTGSYGSTWVQFNADGTWSSGEGNSGLWVKGKGVFIRNFDGSGTIYSGKIKDGEISGIMTTFSVPNYEGCFYLEKADDGIQIANRLSGGRDSQGVLHK